MPERPDLDYALPILARELDGAVISGVKLAKPVVLRQAVEGALEQILVGQKFTGAGRRGPFAVFELRGAPALELIVNPMLGGRFRVAGRDAREPGDLAMRFDLGERALWYRDAPQMGKVYLVPAGDHSAVVGFDRVGLDVLDRKRFTLAAFAKLAAGRRDQVKVFLLDKSALDSLGNAYADEVLFEARIHPKTWVRQLSDDDLARLHKAIPLVLRRASREIARRKPETDEKVRDFLSVRRRHKQPCPRCETPIRKAGVRGHDAFFCPACQPETRRSGIVKWSR